MSGDLSAWLPADLEELAASTRRRALDRIAPLAAGVDRDQEFSHEMWAELREMGIFGLPLPESAGGAGGTTLEYIVALEQIAYACALAGLYPGTTVQVAQALLAGGSPEDVKEWVPRLAAGEVPAAWAFTEPGTGSDPRQLSTRARQDGSDWVLDGQKAFISYAAQSPVALVFARTSESGVTAFLVETDQPGWSVGSKVEVMAFGGTGACTVHLDGVRVPARHVVGAVDDGFTVMLAGEAFGKVRVASINVAIAQRALDEAARFANERLHRGQPIGEKFSSIQGLLAEMEASVLAARSLLYDTAQWIDLGRKPGPRAAALRLVSGRAAREVTGSALQICGAYGLTKDMVVERLYREGKFYDVAQGTAELQRVIVGKSVLRSARP
ncbi:acyl-CoA dehydrogenase family protein [Nonomuraea wenchangensis]|uniref:acyl-CoA dehydrogenase family protein n=1 Tax=Nonomuraea wenchangensis TaxID=568860 RepID=UPI0034437863